MKYFKLLQKVANSLDSQKEYILADRLDSILRRFAQDSDPTPTKEDKIDESDYTDVWDVETEELNNKIWELIEEDNILGKPFADYLLPPEFHTDKYNRDLPTYLLDLLKKYDLHLITSGKDTSVHLGSGIFGKVFSAVCGPLSGCPGNGEVAVKITKENPFNSESSVWKAIQNATKDMPTNLTKHMPKIHKVIKDSVEMPNPLREDSSIIENISIIIMEKLEPLSSVPNLKDLLFNLSSDSKSISDLLKNEEILFALLKNLTKNFMDLNPQIVSEFFKLVLNFKPNPKQRKQDEAKRFKNHLLNSLLSIKQKYESNATILDKLEKIGFYLDRSENTILKYIRLGTFPRNADHNINPAFYHLPETKSLLTFLNALKEKGIAWKDLHKNNLMIRPSTGDLVIVDVGMYNLL